MGDSRYSIARKSVGGGQNSSDDAEKEAVPPAYPRIEDLHSEPSDLKEALPPPYPDNDTNPSPCTRFDEKKASSPAPSLGLQNTWPTHGNQASTPSSDGAVDVPSTAQITTHLKLLHTFARLKADVMEATDLFGIDESFLTNSEILWTDDIKDARSRIREKRWTIFVSRAVDRFECWWQSLKTSIVREPVICGDIENPPKTGSLIDKGLLATTVLGQDHLPPLDVLMVWHSFMLSPHRYLEDCLLQGMMGLWHGGFPWVAIAASMLQQDTSAPDCSPGSAVKANFSFSPGPAAEANFAKLTQRSWSAFVDSGHKTFHCPPCHYNEVPILEHFIVIKCSNFGELLKNAEPSLRENIKAQNLICELIDALLKTAAGWADDGFIFSCKHCKITVNHETLQVEKWVSDVTTFYRPATVQISFTAGAVERMSPPPGCVLDSYGVPLIRTRSMGIADMRTTLPLRLFDAIANTDSRGPRAQKPPFGGLVRTNPPFTYTFESVQRCINAATTCPKQVNYAQTGGWNRDMRYANGRMVSNVEHPQKLHSLRRSLLYYVGNSSPFTINLVGAVLRSQTFSDQLGNIHFDTAVQQLPHHEAIVRYTRFVDIALQTSLAGTTSLTIPTVPIDLVWHTHLCSPRSYYDFCMLRSTGTMKHRRLIDHPEKIPEAYLSTAFARTAKLWQEKYQEPYSDCACWYCASVQAQTLSETTGTISGISRLFNVLGKTKGKARAPQIPTRTSHIEQAYQLHVSNHNSVDVSQPSVKYTMALTKHQLWLKEGFQKACERDEKDGTPVPRRNADNFFKEAPYVSPLRRKTRAAGAPVTVVDAYVEEVLTAELSV